MQFLLRQQKYRGVLLIIFVSMVCLMSIFELLKQFLSPNITVWESHLITILFSSLVAALVGAVLIANYRIGMLIFEINNDAILITDEDNRILNVNPAFTKLTGYTLDEVRGKNPRLLQSGEHLPDFYRAMWDELDRHNFWQGELWNKRKNGDRYVQQVQIHVIRSFNGKVFRHVAQFSDITDKKRQDEVIWKAANLDELTNLPNRALFQDRLRQALRGARRGQNGLAVLFVDLDYFKQVNDKFGHAKGDVLLVEVAMRLASCLRDVDTVARIGGDEFAVILSDIQNESSALKIAEKLRAAVDDPVEIGEAQFGLVSASIGLCCFRDDGATAEDLVDRADKAMYIAKKLGRNRISVYSET